MESERYRHIDQARKHGWPISNEVNVLQDLFYLASLAETHTDPSYWTERRQHNWLANVVYLLLYLQWNDSFTQLFPLKHSTPMAVGKTFETYQSPIGHKHLDRNKTFRSSDHTKNPSEMTQLERALSRLDIVPVLNRPAEAAVLPDREEDEETKEMKDEKEEGEEEYQLTSYSSMTAAERQTINNRERAMELYRQEAERIRGGPGVPGMEHLLRIQWHIPSFRNVRTTPEIAEQHRITIERVTASHLQNERKVFDIAQRDAHVERDFAEQGLMVFKVRDLHNILISFLGISGATTFQQVSKGFFGYMKRVRDDPQYLTHELVMGQLLFTIVGDPSQTFTVREVYDMATGVQPTDPRIYRQYAEAVNHVHRASRASGISVEISADTQVWFGFEKHKPGHNKERFYQFFPGARRRAYGKIWKDFLGWNYLWHRGLDQARLLFQGDARLARLPADKTYHNMNMAMPIRKLLVMLEVGLLKENFTASRVLDESETQLLEGYYPPRV